MASEMESTFYPPQTREKTRQALEDVLALAKECMTDQEIWHEVYCALGLDDEPYGGSD